MCSCDHTLQELKLRTSKYNITIKILSLLLLITLARYTAQKMKKFLMENFKTQNFAMKELWALEHLNTLSFQSFSLISARGFVELIQLWQDPKCRSPRKNSIIKQFLEVAVESCGIWSHDHRIPFRRSSRLSYQTMSSTCTPSQLCTAALISSSVRCQISFRLLLSYCFRLLLAFVELITRVERNELIDMVFTTERSLEVVIII